MRATLILPGFCLALVLPDTVSAQRAPDEVDSTKAVRVVRVGSRPTIDGILDEPAWEQADVITDFPSDPAR